MRISIGCRFVVTLVAIAHCNLALAGTETPRSSRPSASSITYAGQHRTTLHDAVDREEKSFGAAKLEADIQARSPDSYAGMYIEHEPEFRVVVRFTGDARAQLAAYTRDPVYVAQEAPHSLELLVAVQEEVGERLIREGLYFESEVDVRNSTMELYVQDERRARRVLSTLLANNDFIRIHVITGRITPTAIRGGTQVTGATQHCTLGYNVKTTSLELGAVTAGHCDNALTHAGTSKVLAFQGELNAGNFDVQWNKEAGSGSPQAQPNEITLIGGPTATQEITAVIPSSGLTVGTHVCKSGISGHYTCGVIENMNAMTEWRGSIGTYIRARSDTGAAMSVEGDSGGPVFIGAAAVGVIHARGDSLGPYPNDLYFMPIERLSNLGVSILTEPFEITGIADVSGPYYEPTFVDVNYSGIPKFPVTLTVATVVCPGEPCGEWSVSFPDKAATPLQYYWGCASQDTSAPVSGRLRTTLTDASGISTEPVEHNITCTPAPGASSARKSPSQSGPMGLPKN